MGGSESKVADVQGEFLYAIEDGWNHQDAEWVKSKFIVTTQRLIILTIEEDRFELPYDRVDEFEERVDVSQAAREEASYTALRSGEDVVLLSASGVVDQRQFETELCKGAVAGSQVHVRHPATKGGVVRDGDWVAARLSISEGDVAVVLADGRQFEIDRFDIGRLREPAHGIEDENREVIALEHPRWEQSVLTWFALESTPAQFFRYCLEDDADRNAVTPDLQVRENRILLAIYAGLEPEEIEAAFGFRASTIRGTIGKLLDLSLVDGVDGGLAMTTRGRRLAQEVDVT